MRLLIVTDAWLPQVNGVVRTHQALKAELESQGVEVSMITPDGFLTLPCPTYPEIRLSLFVRRKVARAITETKPDAIHISTEGPLGLAARRYCLKNNLPFTTAYHTRFPEYVEARTRIPADWVRVFVRWFHKPSRAVMTATESLRDELRSQGFKNVTAWTRGIDTKLFHPRESTLDHLPGPVFLYVGRVAVEKNIDAFLKLDLPGSKVVVGDGPQLQALKSAWPDVHFAGMKEGKDLADYYASADVFVFPSLTDTFGLVILEALASGTPVAAYPVTGPIDIFGEASPGCLDTDLQQAALTALNADREQCRHHAMAFSWDNCARGFLDNLTNTMGNQRLLPGE